MSIADDVRSAMTEVNSTPAEPPAPSAAPTQDTTPTKISEPPAGRARDEHGRFAPKEGDKQPTEAALVPPNGDPKAAEPAAPPLAKKAAPQSWRPTIKEKWEALPPEVQEEVLRIEGATTRAIQQAAEHRKSAERWQKALEPFQRQIQGDPVAFIGSVLPAAVALQSGAPEQKAVVLAHLMKAFGISEQHLVNALDGKVTAPALQQPQQHAPPDYRDPRVDDLLAQINRQKVQEFASKAEFLNEPMPDGNGTVREAMADYMDWQESRGVAVSLQQAYDYVVAGHPTISEALKQRQAAKAQAERAAQTAKAQAAASSVRGEPVVGVPESKGGSILDDVRASVAMLNNR